MVDIFLIGTVINTVWTVLSMLFVLYRFTSFFSMIYNFIKFLGKIGKGIVYIKNKFQLYIMKRNGYSVFNNEHDLPTRPKTFFESVKSKYNDWFGTSPTTHILPLHTTTYTSSSNNLFQSTNDELNFTQSNYYSSDFPTFHTKNVSEYSYSDRDRDRDFLYHTNSNDDSFLELDTLSRHDQESDTLSIDDDFLESDSLLSSNI
jgi:hypothetical protein